MSSTIKPLKFNEEHVFIKVPSSSGKGLSAIITTPHALHYDDFYAKGYEPSTHKMVIIAHGNGGHKNYCYHSILAEKLLSELGMFSIRFDFRNCGDSEDNKDPNQGRVIEQDVEDLDAIAKFVTSGLYKDTEFTISSIIAHSRGSAAMFLWAVKQQEILEKAVDDSYILVPNLINCAGRFDYSKHLIRVKNSNPTWEQDGFYTMEEVYKDGEYRPVFIPRNETLNITSIDLSGIKSLGNDVLSIYGLEDKAVPLEDAALFANLLGDRHQLKFIKNADHNYYGTEGTPEIPLNSKGKYNYNFTVAEYIKEYLSHKSELARFYTRFENIKVVSRWKQVEGIANFRDIGGWRVSSDKYVRPNFGFRCALPSLVSDKGKEMIKELNIKAVFDFRSILECKRDGIFETGGLTRYHVPVFKEQANGSPQDLMLQYKNLIISWATYKDIYRDMLTQGVDAFKAVLDFIKDHPNEGFLFHCSAGKDRTGLMGMLIYLICGLDYSTISKEYELTTIGLRPMYPMMKKEFLHSIAKHGDKIQKFHAMVSLGRENWTIENDGFDNIVSSRCEAMLATIDMFNKEFGGIQTYLTQRMGYTEAEIDTIRSNLTIDRSLL